MNNISRRLERLQNAVAAELQKSAYVCLTFADGTKERRKFLPLLFEVFDKYERGEQLPDVVSVQYLFDEKKQGILPQLLCYMLEAD